MGPNIYNVEIEVEWGRGCGVCLKFVKCQQIFFCFQTKNLLFIFADGGGQGSHNWSYNWPKYFKITTNSFFRSSNFSLNITSDTFCLPQRTTPNFTFPTPLTTKPKQGRCYFHLALNFLCEKKCGLMNIASWLAQQQKPLEQGSVTNVVRISQNFLAQNFRNPFFLT